MTDLFPHARYAVSVQLALMLMVGTGTQAVGQVLQNNWWGTNGTVNAIEHDTTNHLVYIGGDFTEVAITAPYGVPLDAASGDVAPNFPRPNGNILAAVEDGAGGWYIGGTFTKIGGVTRNRLARVNADGTLHAWNPNADQTVNALLRDGNTIYVGGNFWSIGGQSRFNLAALDGTTGNPTSWAPSLNGVVRTMVLVNNTLFVGGDFSTVGVDTRLKLAAFTMPTGSLSTWAPSANGSVMDMKRSGSLLYVCGQFTTLDGQPRNRIGAITTGGTLSTWDAVANGNVLAMSMGNDKLFVGGTFTEVGGQFRDQLAALSLTDATASAWNPGANGGVSAIMQDGSNVYVGGNFTEVGGVARRYLAKVSDNGTVLPWAPEPNLYVDVIANGGPRVFIAGGFQRMGAKPRQGLAALDEFTGQATSWTANTDGVVNALHLDDGVLYVGGSFATVSGASRGNAASFTASTGELRDWDPQANGAVRAIDAYADLVFLGGDLSQVGGASRTYLGAVDKTTGVATSLAPDLNGAVYALGIDPAAPALYLGGAFTTMDGEARGRLAAMDMTSGSMLPWNPDAQGVVRCMIVSGMVYVGGEFTGAIGSAPRNRVAALDPMTGLATAWNPNANNTVRSLAIQGGSIYAGGSFTTIGSATRNRLAALNNVTGSANTWDPNANDDVLAISAASSMIHAGGAFTMMTDGRMDGLAAWRTNTLSTGSVPSPLCAGFPLTVPYTASGVFSATNEFRLQMSNATGSFLSPVQVGSVISSGSGAIEATIPAGTTAGTAYRFRVVSTLPAMIAANNGQNRVINAPTQWYLDADADGDGNPSIDSLSCVQPTGYVSNADDCDDGDPDVFIGASCDDANGLTSDDVIGPDCICQGSMQLVHTPPMWTLNNTVRAMSLDTVANVTYLGGDFTSATPSPALQGLVPTSPTTGFPLLPFPSVVGVVRAAIPDGQNGWYIGGDFTQVGGLARKNLAHIGADGTVLPLALTATDGLINALVLNGSTLYVGGNFTTVNGATRRLLCALTTTTGTLTSLAHNFSGVGMSVRALLIANNRLFIGGRFTQVNSIYRDNICALDLPQGTLASWNPAGTGVGGEVYTMDIIGTTLYIGGDFWFIGSPDSPEFYARYGLAALNTSTGAVLAWNPSTQELDGSVYALVAYAGANAIYVGGTFTTINGISRRGAAAISTVTSGLYTWDAGLATSTWLIATVSSITKLGDAVYLGGSFLSAGGVARPRFAAVTYDTGALLPWSVGCQTGPGGTLVRANTNEVLVASASGCGTRDLGRLAAFDNTNGQLVDWAPIANNTVHSVLYNGGSSVYVGGAFSTLNGAARNSVGALSSTTGATLPWAPEADGKVFALKKQGTNIIAGGQFSNIGGAPRERLASLNATTGVATTWDPGVSGSQVNALEWVNGELFVGGTFSAIHGQPRMNLASIIPGTDAPIERITDVAGNQVQALAHDHGRLFIGGSFTSVNGMPRTRLAAIDTTTWEVTDWSPAANSTVQALEPFQNDLYVGGGMTTINGQPAPYLAGLRTDLPVRTPWEPGVNNQIYALESSSTQLHVAGAFTTVQGVAVQGYTVFSLIDCEGIAGGHAFPGAPCDDGLSSTMNDTWGPDCSCTGELITGVATTSRHTGLSAWPNPASTALNLSEPVNGHILDVGGRVVLELRKDRGTQIDLRSLKPGMYLLRTADGVGLRFVKL